MFRTIITQFRKPLSSFTSDFCTKAPFRRREINDVKIVGTLVNDSYVLKSGTKALTVKTKESPMRYSNHNIHINTNAEFSVGQRIYVIGKLRSTNLDTADGKRLTVSVVKALQLYVLENESGSAHSAIEGDKNNVEILANIGSDVVVKDNHAIFTVVTNFTKTAEDGEESSGAHYHRVFAYDDLLGYVKANLKKGDRILLNGRIGHMTNTQPDGKKFYSGFIVAENIFRVARRTKDDAESNESAKVEAEN
ncbi:uncharacterized protein LOC129566786 [Sitodiplosis mosellana]|uniref:uncharacterized protein LOC129566786 n=1 Tax=Sitodiplosis mosellana TaxID=263140 RepID=UPI002444A51C|nr:uncharacterized protein LOC129566786 [Sitodiplosis mosellana]